MAELELKKGDIGGSWQVEKLRGGGGQGRVWNVWYVKTPRVRFAMFATAAMISAPGSPIQHSPGTSSCALAASRRSDSVLPQCNAPLYPGSCVAC